MTGREAPPYPISDGFRTVLAPPSAKAAVELGKAVWQLRDVPEDTIALRTEHSRQVDGTLAIDREAEEMDILKPCFRNGLSRILNAVRTFVFVLVVRLAIRQQ